MTGQQSVTSRLETSQYRDFSHFLGSIGFSLEKFGLEKSLSIGLENFSLKLSLSIGFRNIWSHKKSQCWSQKMWSKKSLGI